MPKILLLLSLAWLCGAQQMPQFPDYTPDTYPNSEQDYSLCGLPEPSLLCDPNGMLNPAEDQTPGALKLHRALQHVRHSTNCSCDEIPMPSPNKVLTGRCLPAPRARGYTISIGVVKKIRVDEQAYNKEEMMHIFTDVLRKRIYRGQCEDDVLIVLSTEDDAVWTSTGIVAGMKITPAVAREVSTEALRRFFSSQDYTGGLLYMVQAYTARLNPFANTNNIGHAVTISSPDEPNWLDLHLWPLFPEALRESAWRWPILVAALLVAIALAAVLLGALVWAVRLLYRQVRHRRAGYSPGNPSNGVKH